MSLKRGLASLACLFFILAALSWAFFDDRLMHWLAASAVDQDKLIRIQKVMDIATLKFMSAAVGPLFLLAGWLLLKRGKDESGRFLVGLGGTITITEFTIDLLKWLFGRLRPHQLLDAVPDPALWFAGGTSFPSGHAGYYAALAGGLAIRFPRHAPLLLLIPAFVSMQRTMVDMHNLSDVLTSLGIAMIAAAIMADWLRPPAILKQM